MQHGNAVPESGPKTPLHLGNQGNFGNQDQHRETLFQGGLGKTKVYFGFPASGHAGQEKGAESVADGPADGRNRHFLLLREGWRGFVFYGFAEGVPVHALAGKGHVSSLGHFADKIRGSGVNCFQCAYGKGCVFTQPVNNFLPCIRYLFVGYFSLDEGREMFYLRSHTILF